MSSNTPEDYTDALDRVVFIPLSQVEGKNGFKYDVFLKTHPYIEFRTGHWEGAVAGIIYRKVEDEDVDEEDTLLVGPEL